MYPISADGARVEPAEPPHVDDARVTMFRAESRDVSLSCGGIFTPPVLEGGGGQARDEEDDVWGDEFEDFLFSMSQLAGSVEARATQCQ